MSGKPETATAIIQSYCDSVRQKVETSVGRPYEVYVAKTFLSRPWEGNSYMIKVHVGGDEYIHVKVMKYHMISAQKAALVSLETGKKLNDPL
ncbi:hypothetical protein AOLI_G00263030 [Acnodon oligacanthus]